MSIRKPIKVLTFNDATEIGVGSTLGGKFKTFQLPQDTDNVVVKLQSSLVGGSVTATLQTTDDGGSTWYDISRTKQASVTNNTVAVWTNNQVIGGNHSTQTGTASTTGGVSPTSVFGTIGSAGASTLGVDTYSGLPIMDTLARIMLIYTGTTILTNDKTQVDVLANHQSNRA